jgi:hypothetical protein
MKLSEQTDRVRQGLTEHTARSKTSHSKIERSSNQIQHSLRKLKTHVRVMLWLDLMFQGSIFRSGTHTHSHFPYTMSVTHPTARMQDISTSHPFSAAVNGSSMPGSLVFQPHRSILLKQDACSPVAHICQHKCLLKVDVEKMQGVTVKRRHVEVLSCTPIKQTLKMSLYCM